MKMIAAVFVVAIHSQPFSGLTEIVVVNILARMAVPFFFVASAFFFFRKPKEKQDWKLYVRRLSILYLFWFIIELPITTLHSFIEPETPFITNISIFVRNFFFGSTFRGSWFIMALMECIPLLCFLSRRFSFRFLLSVGMILYVIIVSLTYYVAFLPDSVQRIVSCGMIYGGHIETTFLSAFIFCLLGKYLAEHEECLIEKHHIGKLVVLVLILASIEVFTVNYYHPPIVNDFYLMLPLLVFLLFLFLLQHEARFSFNYLKLRIYSTIFYFSHFIFVFLLVVVNKHLLSMDPIAKYVIVLILCTILASVMYHHAIKYKNSWLRYGY